MNAGLSLTGEYHHSEVNGLRSQIQQAETILRRYPAGWGEYSRAVQADRCLHAGDEWKECSRCSSADLAVKESELHWYSLTFTHGDATHVAWASVYMGYPDKKITIERMNEAKRAAGVPVDSAMANCCHLGRMTKAEMIKRQEAQPEPEAPAPPAQVEPKPCNEVPPGNGYCDMCAAGQHEKCRYVASAVRRGAQGERAAFLVWNNDKDCPLAGLEAKQAAWRAWQARAVLPTQQSPLSNLPRYRIDLQHVHGVGPTQFLRSDPNGEFVRWSDLEMWQAEARGEQKS